MGKVGISVGLTAEGNQKTVGKPLAFAFHADIRTPLKIIVGIDLLVSAQKVFSISMSFRWGAILKFEHNHMPKQYNRSIVIHIGYRLSIDLFFPIHESTEINPGASFQGSMPFSNPYLKEKCPSFPSKEWRACWHF